MMSAYALIHVNGNVCVTVDFVENVAGRADANGDAIEYDDDVWSDFAGANGCESGCAIENASDAECSLFDEESACVICVLALPGETTDVYRRGSGTVGGAPDEMTLSEFYAVRRVRVSAEQREIAWESSTEMRCSCAGVSSYVTRETLCALDV